MGNTVSPEGTPSPSHKSVTCVGVGAEGPDPGTDEVLDESSQVSLMRTDHFKVMCLVGTTRKLMRTVLAILDTGAGPNLVRESLLPKDWQSVASQKDAYPVIRDANGRKLSIEGVVQLNIDLGNEKLRVRFLVCKNLTANLILGCDFIRRYVQGIFPQEDRFILRDGGAVAIISSKNRCIATVSSCLRVAEGPRRRKMAPTKRRTIRLTKIVSVTPFAEAIISVCSAMTGIH